MEDKADRSPAVPETEDLVEYLLKQPECQEWLVIVKEASGAKEVFGVQASQLSAHSPVFRTMLTDPKWFTSKTVEISDISPQIFRMIFRFVNGGGLPQMSKEEAVQLALAADMYMMPRLKRKACKRLVPTNVQDVFLALCVVPYVSAPDLDPQVAKMIQEKTKEVFNSASFLTLDKQQLEYIFKQDAMSVSEVEVWKTLVKWGQQRVSEDGEKTLRSVIDDLLKFVRLHTLTHEEIVAEVKPTQVLTDGELASLLCAVISKQPWNRPGFCDIQAERKLTRSVPQEASTFRSIENVRNEAESKVSLEAESHFTIKTSKNVVLESFMIKTRAELNGKMFYNVSGMILVKVYKQNCYEDLCTILSDKLVFGGDNLFCVPAKTTSGNVLLLEANNKYVFTVKLSPPHPAVETTSTLHGSVGLNCTTMERSVYGMTVQHNCAFHVREIRYRVLP